MMWRLISSQADIPKIKDLEKEYEEKQKYK